MEIRAPLSLVRPLTEKSRFLGAIARKPIDRPPVWLMRQAGRYLPQYMEVKKQYTFLEMCRLPEIAAEISIQPYAILGVDAIIVFNDILIPLEQLGLTVDFNEQGPVVTPAPRHERDIRALRRRPFDESPPVCDSIAIIHRQVGEHTPVLGFAGAPFTLACYLVEGVTSKNLRYIKELVYARPDLLERILETLTETVIEYLRLQIQAGADAVQIFDTWAGELGRTEYRRFAMPWQKRVIEAIQSEGTPVILYVKGSSPFLEEMKHTGASVLSVDWRIPLSEVTAQVGADTVLQGNLDPTALYAPPDVVSRRTRDLLDDCGRRTGHIFNLGHGVLPQTPVESVQALVDTVKAYEYGSL
ncbi:MAG TPA: uroporphyrinogen decarboxylase [bacterium]|nr:uroporphyrinogen decarboxylase [Candidatus Omnitrophota bacterium]HOJ61171.1 uroporphyrinogen decarboxylase [bacterium]HOL95449.1 uroporphyrinogen decarboxylase [bacterium]HPP01476.1 uroporphyrinogen decarboxylase [bacterium]HXK92461.1 uroporphyrinogen decarboxylase [bacterium]